MSTLDPLRDLATRLSDDFGKAFTIKELTGSSYDPGSGTVTNDYTDHAVTGVVRSYREDLIDGSLVQVGDLSVHVPAAQLAFTPDTDDDVILDGTSWSVVNVRRTYSGDQVAYFRLQVRK
jgi:hypothetical protein